MEIKWNPWNGDAFAAARAGRKPVLLSIVTTWCGGCREMDRISYADPRVAALIDDRFVAIRVDADRRPDLAERYSLGGFPTTAFLTPDGAVVGGGTFVPPDRLLRALDRVLDAFASGGVELSREASGGHRSEPSSARTRSTPESLIDGVFRSYDRQYGGFGTAPKFPLTAPLHLALRIHASSLDANMRGVVECTLDAMSSGELYDEVEGGFFRCAASRNWQRPRREKLLDVNANLVRVLLDAAVSLDARRYGELAGAVIRYAQTTLAESEGGWAGSQEADDEYYSRRMREERATRTPPAVDRTLFAGWNASMISAALHAADALQDAPLGEFAIKSLERVLLACYRPGDGVAHYIDGGPQVRGLLDDQLAMASAALDAAEATGRIPYEMIAEELALYTLRVMWDDREGGLFDRAPAPADENVGLLAEPMKPFVSNCEAARLFTRLTASSGNNEFAGKAREIIVSMEARAPLEGPLAAHYLLAMRDAGVR